MRAACGGAVGELGHAHLELVKVEGAVLVHVKDFKCLAHLGLLLLGEVAQAAPREEARRVWLRKVDGLVQRVHPVRVRACSVFPGAHRPSALYALRRGNWREMALCLIGGCRGVILPIAPFDL